MCRESCIVSQLPKLFVRGVMHSMCVFFLYCMQQKAAARSCRMLWDVFSRKKFSSRMVNASVRCCLPFCSQQVNACCNVVLFYFAAAGNVRAASNKKNTMCNLLYNRENRTARTRSGANHAIRRQKDRVSHYLNASTDMDGWF